VQKLIPRITVIRVLLTSAFLVSLFWLLFDPHEHIVAGQTTDDDYLIRREEALGRRGEDIAQKMGVTTLYASALSRKACTQKV